MNKLKKIKIYNKKFNYRRLENNELKLNNLVKIIVKILKEIKITVKYNK